MAGLLASLRIGATTSYAELLNIRDQAHRIYISACRRLTKRQTHDPPCVHRARLYIEEHLTEDLNVGRVANHVSLCPTQFGRQLKQATGLTFPQYLARHRVERAKELLRNTDLKILGVSFEAGFHSLPTFYRAFRRFAGDSPTAYRRSLVHSTLNRRISGRKV